MNGIIRLTENHKETSGIWQQRCSRRHSQKLNENEVKASFTKFQRKRTKEEMPIKRRIKDGHIRCTKH